MNRFITELRKLFFCALNFNFLNFKKLFNLFKTKVDIFEEGTNHSDTHHICKVNEGFCFFHLFGLKADNLFIIAVEAFYTAFVGWLGRKLYILLKAFYNLCHYFVEIICV